MRYQRQVRTCWRTIAILLRPSSSHLAFSFPIRSQWPTQKQIFFRRSSDRPKVPPSASHLSQNKSYIRRRRVQRTWCASTHSAPSWRACPFQSTRLSLHSSRTNTQRALFGLFGATLWPKNRISSLWGWKRCTFWLFKTENNSCWDEMAPESGAISLQRGKPHNDATRLFIAAHSPCLFFLHSLSPGSTLVQCFSHTLLLLKNGNCRWIVCFREGSFGWKKRIGVCGASLALCCAISLCS